MPVEIGAGVGVGPSIGALPWDRRAIQRAEFPWQYSDWGNPPMAQEMAAAYPSLLPSFVSRAATVPVSFVNEPTSKYAGAYNNAVLPNKPLITINRPNSGSPATTMLHEALHANDRRWGTTDAMGGTVSTWWGPNFEQKQVTEPDFARWNIPKDSFHYSSPAEWYAMLPTLQGPGAIPPDMQGAYQGVFDWNKVSPPPLNLLSPEEYPWTRREMLGLTKQPGWGGVPTGEPYEDPFMRWAMRTPVSPPSIQQNFGYNPGMSITDLVRAIARDAALVER
jgi:hypothetical protein